MKRFWVDLHIGGKYEIMRKDFLSQIASENTFSLGDNIELANCKDSEVEMYQTMRQALKERHGKNYLDGNHERNGVTDRFIITPDRCILAHGDLESDPDRWIKYRNKPHGAGWFKRNIWSFFVNEFEDVIGREPKTDFLIRASKLAKDNNCHTYICGHFHPKEMIDVNFEGTRIIILPRGLTELDL